MPMKLTKPKREDKKLSQTDKANDPLIKLIVVDQQSDWCPNEIERLRWSSFHRYNGYKKGYAFRLLSAICI